MRVLIMVLCALLAACAAEQKIEPHARLDGSLRPGSIGVVVERAPAGVAVAAVKPYGAAAAAGVHPGDIVLRYNGAAVVDSRGFNRLMIGSRPGSVVHIDVMRDGAVRTLDVPVRELDTMPRA